MGAHKSVAGGKTFPNPLLALSFFCNQGGEKNHMDQTENLAVPRRVTPYARSSRMEKEGERDSGKKEVQTSLLMRKIMGGQGSTATA